MIVRKFTCTDGDLGIGWMPNWVKDAAIDPGTGITVSHDILEHIVDDIGGAEGELMALGALLWIRGESGWFYQQSMFYRSITDILGSDIARILEQIEYGNQTLKSPGITHNLGDDYSHVENDIDSIISKGINEYLAEQEYRSENPKLPIFKGMARYRMRGWLRKGFRKAVNYYRRHGLCPDEVAHIFDQITKEADRHDPFRYDEGEVLTIKIDFKTQQVHSFVEYA